MFFTGWISDSSGDDSRVQVGSGGIFDRAAWHPKLALSFTSGKKWAQVWEAKGKTSCSAWGLQIAWVETCWNRLRSSKWLRLSTSFPTFGHSYGRICWGSSFAEEDIDPQVEWWFGHRHWNPLVNEFNVGNRAQYFCSTSVAGMGLDKAKSLLKVTSEYTFLDLFLGNYFGDLCFDDVWCCTWQTYMQNHFEDGKALSLRPQDCKAGGCHEERIQDRCFASSLGEKTLKNNWIEMSKSCITCMYDGMLCVLY